MLADFIAMPIMIFTNAMLILIISAVSTDKIFGRYYISVFHVFGTTLNENHCQLLFRCDNKLGEGRFAKGN